MHPGQSTGRVAFGDFVVDFRHSTLRRGDVPIHLTPKAFSVLVALLRRGGNPVSKEDLIREVWADSIGTEANLSVNIAALRRALGEGPRDHRYIVTLPLFGYQFVGETRELEPVRSPAGGHPAPHEVRLAVLPFRPLGDVASDGLMAFGLTDGLITELARRSELVVLASGFIRRFAEGPDDPVAAAAELNVEYLVQGSLKRDGDGWIATVQLVRGTDGTAAWGFSSRVPEGSGLQLPATLAAGIAAALNLHGEPRPGTADYAPPTSDEAAHELYLRGRQYCLVGDPSSMLRAVDLLEQAVARDPEFAAAYAQIAEALHVLWIAGAVSAADGIPRMIESCERALAIDPTLALAHVNRANIHLLHDWNRRTARESFLRAIAFAPNNARCYSDYAFQLVVEGRPDEACRTVHRALEIDPISPVLGVRASVVSLYCRRFEIALREIDRVLEQRPRSYWGHFLSGITFLALGRSEEAVRAFRQADEEDTAMRRALPARACAEIRVGNAGFGRDVISRIEADSPPPSTRDYDLALVKAYLGEVDDAMTHLEAACRSRDSHAAFLCVNPMWDPFRSHPVFARLVDEIAGPPDAAVAQ